MQTDKKLFASRNNEVCLYNEVCLSINKKLLGSNKPTHKKCGFVYVKHPQTVI